MSPSTDWHDWTPWGETPLGSGRTCRRCGRVDDGSPQPCSRTTNMTVPTTIEYD